MKYYLIDYENVNTAGLDGIDEIPADSRVYIFYTKHSSKIDLGMFNTLRGISADLTVVEVHHGKQALDIQLGSFVGFLIGTEGKNSEYIIISKDKGYRNIQEFWGEHSISLCTSIREYYEGETTAEPPVEPESAQSASAEPAPAKAEPAPAKNEAKAAPAKSESKPAPAKAESRKKTSSKQKPSAIRNEVNTEIQKILSKAGYSGEVINATASFVSKSIEKDGYKQLIYRGIIKEHGQKEGLRLYRLIKEVL